MCTQQRLSWNEPQHENTLLETCVPSKDSAQMSLSMRIRSLRHVYPAKTKLKWALAWEYAPWDMCTQQRLSSNEPQQENTLLETCVPSKDSTQMSPSMRICSLGHVYPAKDSAQMSPSMRICSLGHVYPAKDSAQMCLDQHEIMLLGTCVPSQRLSSNVPQYENMLLGTCVPSKDSAQMSPSMRICSLGHVYPAKTQLKWASAREYAPWDMCAQQRLNSNEP